VIQPTSTEDIPDKPPVDDLTYFLETQKPPELEGDEKVFMQCIVEFAQRLQDIRNVKRDTKEVRFENKQDFKDFEVKEAMSKCNQKLCKTQMNEAYNKIKNTMSNRLTKYLNDTKIIEKKNRNGNLIKQLSWIGRFLGKKIPQTQDELLRRNNQLEQQLTNYNKLKAIHSTANKANASQSRKKPNGHMNNKGTAKVPTRHLECGDYDAPPEFLGADFHPDAPYLNDDDLY